MAYDKSDNRDEDPNGHMRTGDIPYPGIEGGLYSLEYLDGDRVRVTPVARFANDDALISELERSGRDLLRAAIWRRESPSGWAVRARAENGACVATITFEELIAEQQQKERDGQ